ncbi:chromophore lyase, partial [Flavobacterium sp. ZS1P14]
IAAPTAALAVTTTVTPIKCNANGSVVVNVTGGWGGNTYTLTQPDATVLGPQASNTFTNLTQVGLYTARVTDANNCIVTATFTLTTPTPPTASIAGSDLCYDTTNQATLIVTAAAGVGPYQYSIDNGLSYQLSNTFANVTPGNYTIIVKDAYGCKSVGLAKTIAPQLTVTTVLTKDLDCNTPPAATITGTITGGYTGFTYAVSFNGGTATSLGAVTGSTFTYNTTTPGTYQFQVTDANGCPAQSGVITINPIVSPVITSITQTQQIYCFGDTTGAIKVNINTSFGTAPYVINVVKDNSLLPGPPPNTNYNTQTSGLPAGNYIITVTDAKGCTDIETKTISEPVVLTTVIAKTDITCSGVVGGGSSLGSISATPSGGTGPYTYSITNNVGAVIPPPTIAAGVYTFNIINFGIYELSFTDANGCTKKDIINMASPPTDLIINTTPGPPSCSTASIIVSVNPAFVGGPYHFALFPIISGSTPPYDYTSNPGSYQNATSAIHTALPDLYLQSTFNGLNPGVVYSFIVYDESTHCYFFKQATAPTQTTSTLTSTVTPKNVTCTGMGNGSVDFTFTDTYPVSTDVSYQVFNSQTNLPTAIPIGTVSGLTGTFTTPIINIGLLAPGTYYILFKESSGGANNGCTNASTTFTITQSAIALTVNATILENENCNKLGQVSVIAQGGTAGYTYQVLPSLSPKPVATDSGWVNTNTFSLAANSYIAYAKDANGCIQETVPFTLSKDPTPVVSAVLNNQCAGTEGNFAIDVTVATVGMAPYSFAIDAGAFQTQTAPFTVSNLSSGAHSVEIKDVNGCGNKVNLTILAPLGLTPTVTALPSCANNDGVITVNAIGGSVPANY